MLFAILLAVFGTPTASGQLNQNCTVSVLNRTVSVNPDGSWVLPNVPANFGQVKARATCVQNGVTTFGESAYFSITPNSAVNLPAIALGVTTPIPDSLTIQPASSSLTSAGQTAQLAVTANYPDGSNKDVTGASAGTNYTISNPAIATISADGLVTAVSSGTVVIQANNDGGTGIATITVILGGSSHGGIPDSWAIAHGLNPADPLMPFEDKDRDGLTNLQEFQAGTDPNNPDTDGDGLSDGDEVNKYHTNPLLADTDGDLIPDGVEVQTGSNPLDPKSYDLKKAAAKSILTPASFVLATSLANPVISQQLSWKVLLIDGKTTLDLTADPRTSYTSSNLTICSFGTQAGLIYSGTIGSCTITIQQNDLTATVSGTVSNFVPTEVSTLTVLGAVAVDVAGNFAYVATGKNGLTVVDVTNRTKPLIRGTLQNIGDAEAIRTIGQNVLIADATGNLRVVNAENPDEPVLISSVAISGKPAALAVHMGLVAVAAQLGGVSFVDISDVTAPQLLSTLSVPASAVGVDFDPKTGVVAVAMGTTGLQIADISTMASPKLRGMLAGGDVRRVLLRTPAALLADAQRSVTAVNISNPDSPAISLSLSSSLGGVPVDIAAFGNLAMTADIGFGRAVPIINVSNPLQPAALGFWPLSSPGISSSIAIDLSFGYLIIPATGTLRILKYQDIVDTLGVPPTVSITSPFSGEPLIQGQIVTVAANATDDVDVESVSFQVNGQALFSSSSQPYQFSYIVPPTATILTFGATATDFGNNVGTAPNVVVSVIPDPLTTVNGRVVTTAGTPVEGATVNSEGISATTSADGSFSISGLPTIHGSIVVNATASVAGVTLAGSSAPIPPVIGSNTNVGDIQVGPHPIIFSIAPKSALAGTTVSSFKVAGANLNASSFSFSTASGISIAAATISSDGTSAVLSFDIPATTVGTFALIVSSQAGSTDAAITPVNRFTVVDPNSTADTDRDGFQDAIEAVFGTDPLDPLSLPTIPAATETESVVFSLLNAPVTGAGITEAESVAFSLLNAPVAGAGITEAESTTFSVLNAPVTDSGVLETESVAFSVLNSPANSAGATEAESYFSVLNNGSSPKANHQTATNAGLEPTAITQTDPTSVPVVPDPFLDSDGDGLPDWFEALIGTDPTNPDTDADGLTDFEELFIYHTNPLLVDTDGDSFTDGEEVSFGSDPLNPSSTPLTLPHGTASLLPGGNDGTLSSVTHRTIRKNPSAKGEAHVKAISNSGAGTQQLPASLLVDGRDSRPRTN